jgi:hypothetical protein
MEEVVRLDVFLKKPKPQLEEKTVWERFLK